MTKYKIRTGAAPFGRCTDDDPAAVGSQVTLTSFLSADGGDEPLPSRTATPDAVRLADLSPPPLTCSTFNNNNNLVNNNNSISNNNNNVQLNNLYNGPAWTGALSLSNGGSVSVAIADETLPPKQGAAGPPSPAGPGGGGAAPGGGSGGSGRRRGRAVLRWAAQRARRGCTRKLLLRRVPILAWLPQYTLAKGVADLVAGFTVGLTVIPQAIAYASVAGLPPQYGLYSSFMACFIYTIFGSCKDSPVGPTAIAAILTRENLQGLGPPFAVLLCFLSGCVELLMGILQLGFLIDFISGPVSVGFTSAAAIIIATTQVKDVLGLKFSGSEFLEVWRKLFEHITETRKWDAILGFACMAVLLLLRKVKDIPVGPADPKEKTKIQKILGQLLWFVSTTRNIIVVVVCAVMAYMFKEHGEEPFILTGEIKGGLPEFTFPPFSAEVNNQTYTFLNMVSNLSSATFVVPLLAILENIALAKVFSEGKPVDATQEMIALGVCNIMSSFVGSMPVSGALSRGAVNHASGVATTFGGIYTGIIVILSLHLFTPYFAYIPKASLAAVIIAAVVFMVEFHVVKPMWRTKKIDLIPACATFLSCLFYRLELGIVVGIGINVVFLLYASARPSVKVEKFVSSSGCEYLLITPDRSLVFPSVEYVRNVVSKAGIKQGSSSIPVVIDSRHIQAVDFTAAKGIKSLIEDFYKRNQPILFYNLKPSVVEIFQGVQPKDLKHCSNEAELNEMLKAYANQTQGHQQQMTLRI
ncbi:sodium-independent sulfate anion transporter-like [Schistocerca piceifrons]|uniref:sodium-independent sulfate anion transporter-like n=1 Tax=Schistocerca piceifrons TaxID=274613 RepID=UPI001F5E3DFA|nr:sodium-independent sulfate anion transporter-like [Schistocerca piceifrons]